jgi:hypothetical protein
MPWLFRQAKLGPLVGKRTWGGLVGIGSIPVLMDSGNVTSPSFGYFSPEGKWQIENHGVDPMWLSNRILRPSARGTTLSWRRPSAFPGRSCRNTRCLCPSGPRTPTITRSGVAADQGLAAGVSVWA